MRIDDEVFAVLMAIVIIATIYSIIQVIHQPMEPFTAIGVLNSSCMMGDYPHHVIIGQPIQLCIYVYNHLGKPGFFQVRVKIGDRNNLPSNTTPLEKPPIKQIMHILNENSSFMKNITLTLNKTGTNIALVFELWIYNTTTNEWTYTGRWCHIYVNATEVLPP